MITTVYAAEIRDIISEILKPIADVSTEDHKTDSTITVAIRSTGQVITHNFVHGIGYSSTARLWAQGILITHGPGDLATADK